MALCNSGMLRGHRGLRTLNRRFVFNSPDQPLVSVFTDSHRQERIDRYMRHKCTNPFMVRELGVQRPSGPKQGLGSGLAMSITMRRSARGGPARPGPGAH